MLKLTRRPGQAIYLYASDAIDPDLKVADLFKDGPIEIYVQGVQNAGREVKIGIEAPNEIQITRDDFLLKRMGFRRRYMGSR